MNKISSDEAMVARFQKGDEQAFNDMIEKYKPLMLKESNRHFLPTMDKQDLMQECRVVMYEAMLAYNVERQLKFITLYQCMLKNRFAELVRRQYAVKRKTDFVSEPYIDWGLTEGSTSENKALDPMEILMAKEQFFMNYASLSKREQEMFQKLYNPLFLEVTLDKQKQYRYQYAIKKRFKSK